MVNYQPDDEKFRFRDSFASHHRIAETCVPRFDMTDLACRGNAVWPDRTACHQAAGRTGIPGAETHPQISPRPLVNSTARRTSEATFCRTKLQMRRHPFPLKLHRRKSNPRPSRRIAGGESNRRRFYTPPAGFVTRVLNSRVTVLSAPPRQHRGCRALPHGPGRKRAPGDMIRLRPAGHRPDAAAARP